MTHFEAVTCSYGRDFKSV